MVVETRYDVLDGHLLKWVLAAGMSWLEHNKELINSMNVFPVPDGDTGTNMLLTVQKAYEQVAEMDESHIGIVGEAMARGALMGARGNSGTILSMLFRGFSHGLRAQEIMNASHLAAAMQSAVDYAYSTVSTVMKPVEGTILTVAREITTEAITRAREEANLKAILDSMIDAGRKSLENTPNLLPLLKEAGVVDSGGMGLLTFLEGVQRFIEGKPVVIQNGHNHENNHVQAGWQEAIAPEDEEGYGYDVQFLILGESLDVNKIRNDISAMGWSPLIDGDDRLIKVHIHVHDPGEPLSYAIGLGVELDDIVVENMQAQYLRYVQNRQEREDHRAHPEVEGIAVITVARGDGLSKLFREYGAARIVEGGQTMNPSTEDFLAAIDSLPNEEIIILPNNGNIIMAAEQAASLARDRKVRVVPTRTVPQGISALLAYGDLNGEVSFSKVVEGMTSHMRDVDSIEVTTATRTVTIDDVQVREGEAIGMLNGKLATSGGSLTEILLTVLRRAHAEDRDLASIYYGAGITEREAMALTAVLADTFGNLEFETVYGGQPLYPYIISLE